MRVLGFSVGHDKGAVVIEDGKILVGITQERLSRVKHDGAYKGGKIPFESINYCLDYLGWTYKDINYYVYSTTEIIDDVEEQFYAKLSNLPRNILKFIPHHLAHAYSTFFSSGYDEAVVIVADASGSVLNFKNKLTFWYPNVSREGLDLEEDWTEGISIYKFQKNSYNEVYKKWIKYPVPVDTNESTSLGTLYSIGSLQLVYTPTSHSWSAGKLMGMASYADPKILETVEDLVKRVGDNDIFIPNNTIFPKVSWRSDFYSRSCAAGLYQREQETAAIILAEIAKNLTDSKNVCVAGGSFLNCNANEKILKSNLFQNCYFIPPSDDSGIPLGCAWYGLQQLMDIEQNEMLSPYLGKIYSKSDIISALNENPDLNFEEFANFDDLIDNISYWLTQNRVVGWFQDGSEIGPRALGNRSILASPINSWMLGHINGDIKKREWYRPFAPAVLYEYQSKIFESDVFSPYMLVTTTVKEEWRNKIPAVTHIDNTARHQSVTNKSNPKFYKLIKSFYTKTGVPVLLNTSFNGPEEPIVETPKEAIATFIKNNLDFLVIDNFLISRNR